MTTRQELREAAIEIREQLGPVVLVSPDKRPLHRWKDVLSESEFDSLIERAHGFGLQMWPGSAVLGLDFDGPHAWAAWEATGISLPETARTRTRSGGAHLFFRVPPGTPTPGQNGNDHDLRRKVRLVKAECDCQTTEGHPKPCGVDLLLNGYAILPPTPGYTESPDHPVELARMAVIPQPVLDLARDSQHAAAPRAAAPSAGERIPEGQRDSTLASLAGTMRRRGMSAEAIFEALRVENRRCDPPLRDADLRKIARSVGRYAPADGPGAMVSEHLTDLGNARRLVALYGDRFRWCEAWGCFVAWNGTRWAKDDGGHVMRWAKDTAKRMYAEASDMADDAQRKALAAHALRSESDSRLRAMVNLAKSEEGIPITPDAFDRDPWLFNVPNGTLNLRAGALREHRPEDFLTKLAPVDYDPQATGPVFDAFMWRIFAGDAEMIRFIQQAVGYCLTGQTSEQCWFLCYGVGSNGKSTLLRTLIDLLGDYAAWTPIQTLLVKRGEGIDNDLARLRGARFVGAVESDAGRRLAESLVKTLTGGDKVAARFLYGEYFEFSPEFKLWLGTNHKPEIRGTDHATWRRVRLLPFGVTIPDAEQDRGLLEKLRAELPGILAWAVAGCLAWQWEGLGLPDAVREATSEYRTSLDVVGQFLTEECVDDPRGDAKASDLYRGYVGWCEAAKEHPESQRRIGEALAERGYQRGRGNRGEVVWRGIRLRSEGSEGSEPLFR